MKCPNLSMQTKMDFIVSNYGDERTTNAIVATLMAENGFGINYKKYLSATDIEKMQKIADSMENLTRAQKLEFCTKMQYTNGREIDVKEKANNDFIKEFAEEGLYRGDIPKAYLASLTPEQMSMSVTEIVAKDNTIVPLYLVVTEHDVAMIYNPKENTIHHAGNVTAGGIHLKSEYMPYNFEQVPKSEYNEILGSLRGMYSEIANDVLENDTTSVPITSYEENSREEL